jgi:uncharacterized protein (DUF779 family)
MAEIDATPAARAVLDQLAVKHGPVVFFQSGGCCEGSAAMCLRADELPPGADDVLLGELGGVPFYVNSDQYERWGRPDFVIDVAEGASDSFSLEGPEGVHFVTRSGLSKTERRPS